MDTQFEFPKVFKQYLSQATIDLGSENLSRIGNLIEKWLNPYESKLMAVQSLLVWERPLHSLMVFAVTLISFWFLCTDHIIGMLSFMLLTLYWIHLWAHTIWPTIRVPVSPNEQEEWVPVHADLLSVFDISQYLARVFVISQAYFEAIWNLRLERKSAFVVLMYVNCAIMLVIGHHISGFTLIRILLFTVLLAPAAVYHGLLSAAYMKVEPYLIILRSKMTVSSRTARPRKRRAGHTAETVSDDNANPTVDAAIATRTTESEDESVSDLDILENDELLNFTDDLEPDIELMPDFENVCEDSQAHFMLDADVMPGMDDVDRSRFDPSFMPEHNEHTDSETESLPFDDGALAQHSQMPYQVPLQAAPTMPSAPPSEDMPVHFATAPTTSSQQTHETRSGFNLEAFTGVASRFAAGVFGGLQSVNELRHDPRDRIGDASIEDDLEGSLAFQDSDEFDYEIISRDEVK